MKRARGQHEINLRYADALEMADRHVIYKNGAKEIAGLNGRSITFMAKYAMEECGSSCHLHSSVWDAEANSSLMWDDDAPEHFSPVFRGWLGGQIAHARELAWMFAPTVNSYKRYQPESWAPTALAVGTRQPQLWLSRRGPRSGIPGREPHPGRGLQPVPRVRGDDRRRPRRHRARDRRRRPRFEGNAYEAGELGRVPWNIVDAIDELEASSLAAKAFGADVHHHLVNTAKQEWAAFSRVVTDWERRRCFEQF